MKCMKSMLNTFVFYDVAFVYVFNILVERYNMKISD